MLWGRTSARNEKKLTDQAHNETCIYNHFGSYSGRGELGGGEKIFFVSHSGMFTTPDMSVFPWLERSRIAKGSPEGLLTQWPVSGLLLQDNVSDRGNRGAVTRVTWSGLTKVKGIADPRGRKLSSFKRVYRVTIYNSFYFFFLKKKMRSQL